MPIDSWSSLQFVTTKDWLVSQSGFELLPLNDFAYRILALKSSTVPRLFLILMQYMIVQGLA